MRSRSFTTLAEICHREWLCDILGMKHTISGGIDLYDDVSGIELKCRYTIYAHTFTVAEYQIDEFRTANPDKKLFWAFLLYDLAKSPRRIGKRSIEKNVTKRTIWFYDWDWVRQFPVADPETGPYVYVKDRFFNKNNHRRFRRNGGTLYVPEGSILVDKLTKPKKDPIDELPDEPPF